MKPSIHPTATVHPTAVIIGDVVIGAGAYVGPFCVIGARPEMKGYNADGAGVWIGENTRLEKLVVIDSGVSIRTHIGDNCMIMSGAHIGHDANIGKECTISPKAVIGGHTKLLTGVYVGINAAIHQKQVIGGFAIIGAAAFVDRKSVVLPGSKWVGVPARQIGMNDVGLQRAGIDSEQLHNLTQLFIEKAAIYGR